LGCNTDYRCFGHVAQKYFNFVECTVEQRSSTGVRDAPSGASKYAQGAPLRKGSQRCITIEKEIYSSVWVVD